MGLLTVSRHSDHNNDTFLVFCCRFIPTQIDRKAEVRNIQHKQQLDNQYRKEDHNSVAPYAFLSFNVFINQQKRVLIKTESLDLIVQIQKYKFMNCLIST